MRKTPVFIVILVILNLFTFSRPAGAGADAYRVGVFFWHESSNDHMAFEGVKDGFKIAGTACKFEVQTALGDEERAEEIIRGFLKQPPDLIFGMGTGATRRLMKVIKDTPIVFTAVTNPVQSGITPNWQTSGRNIAGNSNWIETEEILADFKKILPGMKDLGIIYDPNNSVSAMEVREARKTVSSLGLKLSEIKVKTVDDLIPAARELTARKVDSIWIPIDILVYQHVDRIRTVTDPLGIPLLASSHRGIKEGAVFGKVVDYQVLGQQAVVIALKILEEHVPPANIPIGKIDSHRDIINLKAARAVGLTLPLGVLAGADTIIEGEYENFTSHDESLSK